MIARRSYPEEALQKQLVAELEWRLMSPWMFWATPNQRGTRARWEQELLAALGVKPGAPDLFVLGPGPRLIAIECKAPPKRLKGGAVSRAKPRVSADQEAMHAKLATLGAPVLIVRDVGETMAALERLGAPLRGRAL